MNALVNETTASTDGLSIKRIVVAVDLSPHSEGTARYAVSIARPFGASLVLAHVHGPFQMNEFITEVGYVELERERQIAQEELTRLAATIRESYPPCGSAFLIGDPAEEIARTARDLDADLIITASHQPSYVARMLNLDQAPRIMHRAPCPVLVYHGNKAWADSEAPPFAGTFVETTTLASDAGPNGLSNSADMP